MSKSCDGKSERGNAASKDEGHEVSATGRVSMYGVYILCACLILALTLLIVEMIVLLAVQGFPLANQTNVLLRSLNQGSSNLDFNFGITVNQAPSNSATVATNPSASAIHTGLDEDAGSAWFEWCASAPCMRGQNCTEIVLGLAEGVDPSTNAPIIPFPPRFCESASIMNENLCFCTTTTTTSEGEAGQSGAVAFPPEGQAMIDNMNFVVMLCGFDQPENVGENGQCSQ